MTTGQDLRAQLPELSPQGLAKQKIGYTDFEIRYGRPATRGRKIFGGLVPYDKLWRTGAGPGTKVRFDRAVRIGGQDIQAGTYAMVSIPGRTEWKILLNKDTTRIYGVPEEYDVSNEVVRFDVKTSTSGRFYESLTIDLDIVNNNAEVFISWENTQVHFPVLTDNNEKALTAIEKYFETYPNDADNLGYAVFYLRMNHQVSDRLLDYIDRALKVKEEWWFYEEKMNLLADAKRFDEARKVFDVAVKYLHRAKPDDWQTIENNFRAQMAGWK